MAPGEQPRREPDVGRRRDEPRERLEGDPPVGDEDPLLDHVQDLRRDRQHAHSDRRLHLGRVADVRHEELGHSGEGSDGDRNDAEVRRVARRAGGVAADLADEVVRGSRLAGEGDDGVDRPGCRVDAQAVDAEMRRHEHRHHEAGARSSTFATRGRRCCATTRETREAHRRWPGTHVGQRRRTQRGPSARARRAGRSGRPAPGARDCRGPARAVRRRASRRPQRRRTRRRRWSRRARSRRRRRSWRRDARGSAPARTTAARSARQ